MDPYSPPSSSPKPSSESFLSDELKRKYVDDSLVILGSGKGHMAVINHLRSQGMSHEEAKRESYEIFGEARRELKRSQWIHRSIAWFFILLGVLVPIGMLLAGMGFFIVSTIPIALGMGMLFKLPNPKPLP